MEEQRSELQRPAQPDNEFYEELLNRYERILVYAGQLQEKNRQQKLLSERNDSLRQENDVLKKKLALEESYNRLLENALESLGVLNSDRHK